MTTLKRDLSTSRKNAYAEGTAKNLRIQWESFLLFCFHFHLCYLPADTETLCLYSQFLSRTFKSTSAIKKNYLSGVKTMHLLLGYSVEHINDFLLNLGIKVIARLHPYCVRQARFSSKTQARWLWFWYSKFSIFGWWRSPLYLLRGLYFSTYSVC